MQADFRLEYFQKYIESELGIVYAEHNWFQLQNRLEEISKFLGLTTIDQLYVLAQKGIAGSFRQLLLDVATNNETSFFRDINVFKALENSILPSLNESTKLQRKIRIWSAASSTGQEALTASIVINEFAQKKNVPVQFSILATDISSRALEKAKASSYTQLEVQRGLPTQFLIKYFSKDENSKWSANKELKKDISYATLNLKEPFDFVEKFDLIFCRNVLIYQSVQSKIEILKKITSQLIPGGYLILGSGESLLGLSNGYKLTYLDGAVVYQKLELGALAS